MSALNTILKCTCGAYTMQKDHCGPDSATSPNPARYRPEFKHKAERRAARKPILDAQLQD